MYDYFDIWHSVLVSLGRIPIDLLLDRSCSYQKSSSMTIVQNYLCDYELKCFITASTNTYVSILNQVQFILSIRDALNIFNYELRCYLKKYLINVFSILNIVKKKRHEKYLYYLLFAICISTNKMFDLIHLISKYLPI